MASGGPSDRTSSGPRSFGFGSDDVLCAYDDFTNQEQVNGRRSDPSLNDSRDNILGSAYGQQDEYPKEEIITSVEKCMKKYADNLLRHLEGISGRLSQLEIHCYKLERSIGEFRADMIRDHGEADTKLKSLEKHLQEVHRSIQILRDKQEVAEAQKELTKLQLAPKESATPTLPQKSEEAPRQSSVPEPKQHNETHLALALPHQVPPPSSLPTSNPQQPPSYIPNQPVPFYPRGPQQTQPPPMVNEAQPLQSYPQYQHQQWSHSTSQQFAQQPTPQPQRARPPHTPFGYSMGEDRTEAVPYGYGAPSNATNLTSQPQQQQPYLLQSNVQGYGTVYDVDGSRAQGYPPRSSSGGFHQHQVMRSHPYADMVERAAGMGYPREHVVGVVNMMAESGQPVDFNMLLDRLNSRPGAGPPRAWSG